MAQIPKNTNTTQWLNHAGPKEEKMSPPIIVLYIIANVPKVGVEFLRADRNNALPIPHIQFLLP